MNATCGTAKGTVKWFSKNKGYGFVACPTLGKDVFLQQTVVAEAGIDPSRLKPGATVEMGYYMESRGPAATSVKIIEDAPEDGLVSGPFTGTLKFFNAVKGFGFIIPDDSSDDLYVHATGLGAGISKPDVAAAKGGRVRFRVRLFKGRPRAVDLELLPATAEGDAETTEEPEHEPVSA